ncbi:PhoX family phosphatase [Meiothermus sp. CFH 77666]|uniref:PhoX family protein n=1 Tax=Meiothermus sp. CFH 77666 TaxID=2817942 RepID=UPI001AA06C97|nr:PhoX family phosphatase [Meiothermus sp. CFH 77666]MBO1438221.1 PhoX family phosphatase [Meiothermus sp. CFH 77666]
MIQLEKEFHLETHIAGRSPATCHWKCGDACAQPILNQSENQYVRSVVEEALSRRSFMAASMGGLLMLSGLSSLAKAQGGSSLGFKPIGLSTEDKLLVPEGYTTNVVIRWGDPIGRGAKRFDVNNWDARSQENAFGYNVDYISWLPLPDYASSNSRRAILWANHEYTNPELMFPGYKQGSPTKEQVDIELAAHGGSAVEVRRNADGSIYYVPVSSYNRRITATTPMELTGPAAGHPLLQTKADPTGKRVLGMLNNCAGGTTPWGTILTAEENFNQYFAGNNALPDGPIKRSHARYGLPGGNSSRRWELFYERFDLTKEPNEPFRHGWIVEIDPYDPTSTPKKRTALGRFKHEGAETTVAPSGQVVLYMGDDERFDYLYKFVTKGRFNPTDRKANLNLLDEGTLYVAKFNADGTGVWLPLVQGNGPLTAANGFSSQADVLINTRLAADLLGATKMDRPEDVERNPVTGAVYAVMTNNNRRTAAQVDAANPRPDNRHGHIIEMLEAGNDPTATTFRWALFLVAGEPSDPTTYFAGFPKDKVSTVSCPDNITFDQAGNMWIATDGQDSSLKKNDAVYAVPTQGPERGYVRQFMSAPVGAEICGPIFTPDNKNFFAGIQHPGEGGTLEKPVSTWPDGTNVPRPSVVAVRKLDGGIIGG